MASGRPSRRAQMAATVAAFARSGRSRAGPPAPAPGTGGSPRTTPLPPATNRSAIREAAGVQRKLVFRREAQHVAAGDEHCEARAGGQQSGDPWGRRDQLLEVVEDQQHLPVAQKPASRSRRGRPPISRRPSAWAIAGRRSGLPAQRQGARTRRRRGTHPGSSAATCMARRVLPTPPGPVSVSRRRRAGAAASRTARRSRSRPIRRVRGSGSPACDGAAR